MPVEASTLAVGAIMGATVVMVLYTLAAQVRDQTAVARLHADVARLRAAYTRRLAEAEARAKGQHAPPGVAGEFDIVPDEPGATG